MELSSEFVASYSLRSYIANRTIDNHLVTFVEEDTVSSTKERLLAVILMGFARHFESNHTVLIGNKASVIIFFTANESKNCEGSYEN